MALTPKQAAFVREYLVDLNATKAAERAGYSPKTAYAQGARLLKNVEIGAAVAKAQARVLDKAELTAADVIRGLRREAEGESEDTNANSRVTAWGLLGKYFKLFTDKTEMSGADGGPLQVAVNINWRAAK